jgi:hypothetical protein
MQSGLLRSYDVAGDYTAWTYDQAVAIIALAYCGDTKTAQISADAMLKLRDKKLKAWADGYDIRTGGVTAKAIAVGPNAWMGIALLRLYLITNENRYLEAAEETAEFMLRLQVSIGRAAGSMRGGYDEKGRLFNWTSTEHNADFVALMAGLYKVTKKPRYKEAAVAAANWLHREMWNTEEGYYYPGYSDNNTLETSQLPERLDSQTWTILALSAAAQNCKEAGIEKYLHNGLGWIDQYLEEFSYGGRELMGFGKVTFGQRATLSLWSEGTAGYILAARRAGHKTEELDDIVGSLRYLQNSNGGVVHSAGIAFPEIARQFQPGDKLVAHFEGHPNCLFGNVGVYGAGEPNWEAIRKDESRKPYSWYYVPKCPGYTRDNVHTGVQSYRLVNASDMCAKNNLRWASFGVDLGPMDEKKRIMSFDASNYGQLSFWAKTTNTDGAKVKVLFRDAHARDYAIQAAVAATPAKVERQWKQYTVELGSVSRKVDLEKLVHIGIAFGRDVGNAAGTILFIDDIAFTDYRGPASEQPRSSMPAVFPQNWPYNNTGATAWFIFVEADINPFELTSDQNNIAVLPDDLAEEDSIVEDKYEPTSYPDESFKTSRIGIGDWLSVSTNLDLSYRKTQFYQSGHETTMFQWDTRADFWLPPGRDDFSWGPYIRFSGVESNRPYEFENNWGARPGGGFQIYPFSSRQMRESKNRLVQWLWPAHAFVECSEVYYKGKQNSWRPDYQTRAGVDYWKEIYVHDLSRPYWAEVWNGLIWNSTNGFDTGYDTLIFANSLRFGLRAPDADLVSAFSPYVVLESSLSENRTYAWENRLIGGGGVRFSLPKYNLAPEWRWLDRLVIYMEYLVPLAYYRSSAPSSTPDYDLRVGVNVVIGEWWYK